MSTMQDCIKIAPPAGGGVIACRSDNNNQHRDCAPAIPVQQKISAFEDSAGDARKRERRSPGKKGKDGAAVAALEKNVLNRCHHLADNRGSRKNMTCSSQNNHFLHDNDFTYIDADDDLQCIDDKGVVEMVAVDIGYDSPDNAHPMQTDTGGSASNGAGNCDTAEGMKRNTILIHAEVEAGRSVAQR